VLAVYINSGSAIICNPKGPARQFAPLAPSDSSPHSSASHDAGSETFMWQNNNCSVNDASNSRFYDLLRGSAAYAGLFCCLASISAPHLRAQESFSAQARLPNGRNITPAGNWVQLAPFPFALAVRPDGRQIVAPSIGWPFSLNIINEPAGASASVRRIPEGKNNDPKIQVHMGVAYSPDGAKLYDPTGDTGAVDVYSTSAWDHIGRIDLNGQIAGKEYKESFAAATVLSPDGRFLYALDQGNWRIVVIDVALGHPVACAPTGSNPLAIALSPDGRHLYVANSGLFDYHLIGGFSASDELNTGLRFPPFGYPSKEAREGTTAEGHDIPALGDENSTRGSSLWTYDVSAPEAPRVAAQLRLGGRIAEGNNTVVGGASPSGIVAGASHVYVSLAHRDSVAIIEPSGAKLEEEIALSPFTGAQFQSKTGNPLRGVMPFGMALAEQRLYVAESGINSVAVIDTNSKQVLGHIPVGWGPAALSLSPDAQTLYVINNRGKGTGPNAGTGLTKDAPGPYLGEIEFGSLSIIHLPLTESGVAQSTASVLRDNQAAIADSTPLPSVRHAFLIIRENRTYDEILGDLPNADGDPKLARYGMHGWIEGNPFMHDVAVTPNAHALAARFATSDRFFVNGEVSTDGHRWSVGIAATPWLNAAWTSTYGDRRTSNPLSAAPGRRNIGGNYDGPMPEDEPEFGSIWEHVAGARLPLLNYGEGLELEAADERQGRGTDPEGQRLYLNAPVPEPVFISTDRKYPTFNLGIPDQVRYEEFARDFARHLKSDGYSAALTVIRLPNDHGNSHLHPEDGYPYLASYMADNDLALGKIVDTISHSPIWKDTAIFVYEDDAQSGVDHVDAHRSPLLVIGPHIRSGYVGHRYISMASVQKTIYELLGIGPLNLEDVLSADLSDMFTATPNLAPFTFVPSDTNVFDPKRARIDRPKTAAEANELLDCDDPDDIKKQFKTKQQGGSY
jgi:YVTN family beta-propeller protein